MAFASNRDGNYNIFTITADGQQLTRLTDHPADDRMPNWSPDGEHIAFVSYRDHPDADELGELYVMRPNGSEERRLTDIASIQGADSKWVPWLAGSLGSWSPDGQQIATHINDEILILDLEGHVTNLTQHPADDLTPEWSPDGRRLLFLSNRDGNPKAWNGGRYHWEMYIHEFDSGEVTRLGPIQDHRPRWSPDGQWILYSYNDSSQPGVDKVNLYVVNVTDGRRTKVTDRPSAISGEWSPDGRYIAFYSPTRDGTVWVMNADGSGQTGFVWAYMVHRHAWVPQPAP
jgi:Tol biopolymer transport system component